MRDLFLSTPIYYVNDLPHIGHVYTTLVADTIARYRRLQGSEVFFLTGTDEHGQNIAKAAAREGLRPIELADRVVARYHGLWEQLEITHSDFIRTSQERHHNGVREIIRRIVAAGDLYVARHAGWYCASCEAFYTEKELLSENRCPVHERSVEWQSEENLFFRLSHYQDRLLEWYDRQPAPVRPESRRNEVRSFVASGLRDLSVSRADLPWGIPFPGHPGQTVYVWLDALTNYLSALGFGSSEQPLYDRFWAADSDRIHLIGKDILRFHTVYWPAFLMSAGLPLPCAVWAHGWWLKDDKKVSKSVGNVARPDLLLERFGHDTLRFFLLRDMVFGQDAAFSDEAVIERYNSDLANGLGNTVSRLVGLSRRAFDGRTPSARGSEALRAASDAAVAAFRREMDGFAFQRAIEALWRLLGEINQYLVIHEPWKLLGDPLEAPRVTEVLWNGLEAVRRVASCLRPILPRTAPLVLEALGVVPQDDWQRELEWGGLPLSAVLPERPGLFPRIDEEAYLDEGGSRQPSAAASPATTPATNEERPMISIDQFFTSELEVGTVVAAERVPKSNKLVQLTVDLGEEQHRTVVAGIGKQYSPEQLVGRQVVVVANLAPATLMGVESQGMVLAASIDGAPVLLQPDAVVPPGTRVR